MNEKEIRLLGQVRHLLIENAQLSRELEALRKEYILPEKPLFKPYCSPFEEDPTE